MNCTTRISTLKPPLTTIFGASFVLISIIATVANGLVLFIIWKPGHRVTSTTTLLTSLAVTDILVGIIVSPLSCWQVFNYKLKVCEIDYARRYFSIFLGVTSGLTLALISYDRYILLTKLTNYNKYMTKKKLIILLTMAWLVPALMPVFQIKIFGPYIYFLGIITFFFGVLIVLTISYCCIVQIIRKKEKKLQSYVAELPMVESSTNDTDNSEKSEEPTKLTKNKHVEKKDMSRKAEQRERKYVALAQSIVILILFFLLFSSPIAIWTILNLINVKYDFVDESVIQICYIIASFTAQFNSCVNPVIYFWKNPEFRKRAKSFFKRQR